MENTNNSTPISKMVPMNLEAEVGILNCILIEPSLLEYSLDQVSPEDFFDPKNRNIYHRFLQIRFL